MVLEFSRVLAYLLKFRDPLAFSESGGPHSLDFLTYQNMVITPTCMRTL